MRAALLQTLWRLPSLGPGPLYWSVPFKGGWRASLDTALLVLCERGDQLLKQIPPDIQEDLTMRNDGGVTAHNEVMTFHVCRNLHPLVHDFMVGYSIFKRARRRILSLPPAVFFSDTFGDARSSILHRQFCKCLILHVVLATWRIHQRM